MSRAFLSLAGMASFSCVNAATRKPVHAESKRNFYENEQSVVPLPGTNTPSTPEETEILGPRSVVNGVTIRSAAPVESAIKSVREAVFGAYSTVHSYLHDKKHDVLASERQITGTVAALHSKHEDLFPNVIYIVIAGLSGNIVARNRGIVARAVYPVALGTAAFAYLLPKTFENTREFLWRAEQRVLPQVAQQQAAVLDHATGLVGHVEQTAVAGQQKVHDGWENVRQSVSKATGLNIDEEVSKK